MSCENCYNGCGTVVSDECVKYTGDSIESLGIENGDPLAKVEEIILAKLQEYAQGQGITLDCVDLKCDFIEGLLGCCKDKSLCNLIQALVDASCSLKDSVEALEDKVNSTFVFTLLCLAGDVPANPTRDNIIQAIINKLCAINTKVDVIYGDYVKASQLNTLIAAYLASVSGSTQQYNKMVPYVAYEYYGPLTNFDSGGKGKAANGYDKVYLCVGQTVNTFQLPDKRGRVAVGTTNMDGGGALDPEVASPLYTLKQKAGQNYVVLSTNNLPAHTHTATATLPNHRHFTVSSINSSAPLSSATAISEARGTSGNLGYSLTAGVGDATIGLTSPSGAGPLTINVTSAGSSTPVDIRQPLIAAYYIMYIP